MHRSSYGDSKAPIEFWYVSGLGIDGTASGGDTDTYTQATDTLYPSKVAEGYTIYNITDGESATIDVPNPDGTNGGAQGTNIESSVLTGAAAWANGETAGIPECRRLEIDMAGNKYLSIQTYLHAGDANNSCYLKLYATLEKGANIEDDTNWIDISSDVFGAAQLSADGIGGAGETWDTGFYSINTPTPVVKYMIKVVAEFCAVAGQDNEFAIHIMRSR